MENQKKKIVFIVNPISGTRSKESLGKYIEQTIDRDAFDCQIVKTEYAGHAAELASRYASEGIDICVAVGGDGTVNEVARGLLGSATALGIVPCGSGNGLARHLCLPMGMKKSLAIINEAHIIDIDYGLANDRPFFCTCGMGFDAHVALKFANCGKRGLSTYAKMVLQEGMNYQPTRYTIQVEGQAEPICQEAFLVDCANAAQYGNNTYIAPGASLQDGLLDLVVVESINKKGRTKLLTDLFTKTLRSNRHVRIIPSTSFHVHRDEAGAFQIDGDPFMAGTDFDIRLVAGGLKAVCNRRKIEDKALPNRMIDTVYKFFKKL